MDAFSSSVNPWKYARVSSHTPVFTSTSSLCLCCFLSLLPALCSGLGFQGSLGTALNKPTQVSVSSCIYLPLRFTSLFLHYALSEQTQTLILIWIPQGDTIILSEPNRFPFSVRVLALLGWSRAWGEAGMRNMNPGAQRAQGGPTHISMCG